MSAATFDPKLRLAMEEIKAVLRRHDLLGFINIASKTHSEFLLHMEAPWSVVRIEPPGKDGKSGIRIRAKGTQVGSVEHENLESSLSFICDTADLCNRFAQILYALKAQVAAQTELIHEPLTDDRIRNDGRLQ